MSESTPPHRGDPTGSGDPTQAAGDGTVFRRAFTPKTDESLDYRIDEDLDDRRARLREQASSAGTAAEAGAATSPAAPGAPSQRPRGVPSPSASPASDAPRHAARTTAASDLSSLPAPQPGQRSTSRSRTSRPVTTDALVTDEVTVASSTTASASARAAERGRKRASGETERSSRRFDGRASATAERTGEESRRRGATKPSEQSAEETRPARAIDASGGGDTGSGRPRWLIPLIIVVVIAIVASLIIMVVSNRDSDGPKPGPSTDVGMFYVEPGTTPGAVEAAGEVSLQTCTSAQRASNFSGSVKNPTDVTQNYNIFITVTTTGGATVSMLQVNVPKVAPGATVPFTGSTELGSPGATCSFEAERYPSE